MTERVRFHFDPLCPWAWETSKWIREVENVRDIDVQWRLFSLTLVNANGEDPLTDPEARGVSALRTLALVEREHGNEAADYLYRAIGERVHEGDEPLTTDVVRSALGDSGLDASLVDSALDDDSTAQEVRAQHEAAAADAGCFGVPTIVLESGQGIFGPVISRASQGEQAGELWDHVRWLAEQDGFFELKRERDRGPGE